MLLLYKCNFFLLVNKMLLKFLISIKYEYYYQRNYWLNYEKIYQKC